MYNNLHFNETVNNRMNNLYQDMPPIMNDGRNYASWQPEAIINSKIQKQEGIKSNWEYRKYLQNNAQNIMKFNYMDAVNASGNNPTSYTNNQSSSNTPFVFQSTHDKRTPNYGYNNSDLKNQYLTREQLNARMIAPSISTNFN
jgi:hypothetical protein